MGKTHICRFQMEGPGVKKCSSAIGKSAGGGASPESGPRSGAWRTAL